MSLFLFSQRSGSLLRSLKSLPGLLLDHRLHGAGYRSNSEVLGTPSNVFCFLSKPLGSLLAIPPKGREDLASLAWLSVPAPCPPRAAHPTFPFLPTKWSSVSAPGSTTGSQPVSSEMVSRPSCVYAQGGQINISEKQYELNHFLNNKTRPHASP